MREREWHRADTLIDREEIEVSHETCKPYFRSPLSFAATSLESNNQSGKKMKIKCGRRGWGNVEMRLALTHYTLHL